MPDHRYAFGGFVIRSMLVLPELDATDAADGALGQIQIDTGDVPGRIEGEQIAPNVTASAHALIFEINGVGRFWIREGRSITVSPAPGAAEADLRPFILGSALGAICIQRGILAFHASAIVSRGRAAAFLGHRGAGKSTLIAGLAARGMVPLSDDLTIVTREGAAGPLAFPGVPRVKLLPDAAQALDIAGQTRELTEQPKLLLRLPSWQQDPVPLDILFLLEDEPDGSHAIRIERLEGDQAVQAVAPHLYRSHWAPKGALLLRRMAELKRLCRQVCVRRLSRPKRFEHIADVADLVATQFG